jgi:hypothetical protein
MVVGEQQLFEPAVFAVENRVVRGAAFGVSALAEEIEKFEHMRLSGSGRRMIPVCIDFAPTASADADDGGQVAKPATGGYSACKSSKKGGIGSCSADTWGEWRLSI